MAGYIGSKGSVTFASVNLPLVDNQGNTIIHEDGTLEGVDFAPVEAQIASIEEDITSLDTSVAILEDAVENISIDILTHKSILDENYIVEANTSALLMGPISLTGTIDVNDNASLTIFDQVSIDGTLDISGTFSVR